MSNIRNFALEVKEAFDHQDELLFSQLITIDVESSTVESLVTELEHTDDDKAQKIINQVLEDTSFALAEAMNNYLKVIRYIFDEDTAFVFDHFTTFYSSLIPVFNGAETYYQVPAIEALSTVLVDLAFNVDKAGLKGKARKANTAARLISKMFNIMLADRQVHAAAITSPMETSKRRGIFHITNLAFKVYFKLNSVRMCQTFISNIRTGGVDLTVFPISQQVTYRYYLGRYTLFHGKLKQAQEHLLFAFNRCHKDHWNNKRLILHYLIPTRIILGYMPTYELLEQYELTEQYENLITTIRSGNLAGFIEHLETHFEYFYSHLTYLLLKERGVVIIWRCLIKQIYAQKQFLGTTVPVVQFEDCLKAITFASDSTEYDINDIECILVSLISQGYIRGYLQHQKRRLVLSKVNAFPQISTVRVHFERYNETLMEEYVLNSQPPIPAELEQYFNTEY